MPLFPLYHLLSVSFCLFSLQPVLLRKHSVSHSDLKNIFLMQAYCHIHTRVSYVTKPLQSWHSQCHVKLTGLTCVQYEKLMWMLICFLRLSRRWTLYIVYPEVFCVHRPFWWSPPSHIKSSNLLIVLFSTSCSYPSWQSLSLSLVHSVYHRPLTLSLPSSMSVCPFLSSQPSLFRGLFISLERWMRGWGHLQELIKPPSHTHTHESKHTHFQRPTYMQKRGDKQIPRCRCITKPLNAQRENTTQMHACERKKRHHRIRGRRRARRHSTVTVM